MTRLNLLMLIAVLFNISQTNGNLLAKVIGAVDHRVNGLKAALLPGHNKGQDQHKVICESQTKIIGCRDGGLIKITNAVYGRLNKLTCLNLLLLFSNTNCKSSSSLEKVRNSCEDKTHCVLSARSSVFGDPCPGTNKYLEVTYRCIPPVPETCGKFPKCHPSAVCVDNDHCECKAPNQGDGIKGCYPVCWCQASGDPHYIMFDGQRVDFMGTCKYTLSQYQKVGDTCSYAVEVKNEHRSGYTHVAYTRLVDIRVFDTTIRLHLQKRVYVNGKLVFLPYRTAQFEIALSGTYVRLETRCGLVVQFDGASSAIVQVPNVYGNDLTGICGNCNNNPNDDQKDYSRYEVVDDSDLQLQQCGLVVQFDGASSAIVQVPNVYGNDLTGICGNCNNNPNDDQKDYSRYEVVDDSDLQLQQ
ncbi:zonadhesin-like [Mizuhopecten yessoensis]|uniref:zonadhesin-like n=1 Tax=Mizuhopecten yessoensis TaxID=6573 RepID=UPI000B45C471|nr:zonadhesin-like [Mizuhopecten yessoensis]